MSRLMCLAWLALSLVAGGAFAQGVDCKNPVDQTSMSVCASRRFQATDARMNVTYRALLARVSAPGKTKLRAAQRAWLAYRDSQCAFETAATLGASIHPMVVSGCLEALTLAQGKRLGDQLHCQEGDMSCGNQ